MENKERWEKLPTIFFSVKRQQRNLRGVMGNVLDCSFEVSEFEFQSRLLSDLYSWERYDSIIFPAMCEIAPLLSFYKDGFNIN